MNVIGGNYGADGKAQIATNGVSVNGERINQGDIEEMFAKQHSQREFSALVLFSGVLLFVPLCWGFAYLFLGSIAGFLAGLAAFVLTLFACFDYKESRIVTINTKDGKTVSIQCKKKDATKLMEFAP